MKKLIILFIVMFFVSSGFSAEKNVLSTNVLGLLFGAVNAHYEMALNEKTGLSFGIGYSGISTDDWKISATGIGAGYYIYPAKEALKGFFVGPTIGITMVSAEYKYKEITGIWPYWTVEEKTDSASGTYITIGGDLGYRWIWKGGVAFGLGIGVGFTSGEIKIAGEKAPYGGTGLTRLSVDFGYAW